jgi:transposase
MQANVRMLRKRRHFSEDFRKRIVGLFESGRYNVAQISSLYGICLSLIYRWIYHYSQFNKEGCRIIEMKQSATNKVKELEQRIKELERMVGQKQIKIDFLETMIDVAEEELKIDIKKKPSTSQSTSSGKKRKA